MEKIDLSRTSDSAEMTSDTSKVELDTRSTRVSATDADIISPLGSTRQPPIFSRASPPYGMIGAARDSRLLVA